MIDGLCDNRINPYRPRFTKVILNLCACQTLTIDIIIEMFVEMECFRSGLTLLLVFVKALCCHQFFL